MNIKPCWDVFHVYSRLSFEVVGKQELKIGDVSEEVAVALVGRGRHETKQTTPHRKSQKLYSPEKNKTEWDRTRNIACHSKNSSKFIY